MEKEPRVGIGIMIIKEGKVLLGKRKGAFGEGSYGCPGGRLEQKETFEECALRELDEECGVKVKNLRFQCLMHAKEYMPQICGTIGFIADWESGHPEVREPNKCESWDWYPLDALPKNVFGPSRIIIQSHKNRKPYFDDDAYRIALRVPENGTVYDKLIRDRIPEKIRSNGTEPETYIADDEEYASRLAEKLIEEAHEFAESRFKQSAMSCRDHMKEELADILEVFESICAHHGFSPEEIQQIKQLKSEKKGSFKKRIILTRA